MKRFYSEVKVTPNNSHWEILLDNRPVKTPAKNTLAIPSEKLAEEISVEWQKQEDQIIPDTMPLTQLLMTIIDHAIPNRAHIEQEILGFIDTDLTCYRTDDPEIYAAAQKESWNPVLDWIENKFKARPRSTEGLAPLSQPKELHKAIEKIVLSCDDYTLSCLHQITNGTGSVFLGLAFLEQALTNEDIFNAAFIEDLIKDEIYLADTYGISPDQEKKRNTLESELETCRKLLDLI